MSNFAPSRKLYTEYLPDDFVVYKAQENAGFYWLRTGGIPAKAAVTSCCESRPVKYFPDYPDKTRWWLICAGCHYAIKANGDAG